MKAIDLLLNRNSHAKLGEPAPNTEELNIMFEAAVRAPDHAYLRPWRFITVQGDERVEFGRLLLAAAIQKSDEILTEAQQQKILTMPLRAPMLLVVANHYQFHAKVPKLEQELATGAALVNFQLAAEAQGYSSVWRTGELAHNEFVLAALGFEENDSIIGFLYMGSAEGSKKKVKNIDPQMFVKTFTQSQQK